MKWGVLLLLFGLGHGFLLNNGNSSIPVKSTFVTVSEYYDGQSKTQDDLNKIRQVLLDNQDQQKKTLNLLASQLQNKLDAFEQQLNANSNQAGLVTKLQQEVSSLKNDSDNWKQIYQTLEENYKKLESESKILKQNEHKYQTLEQEVNILKTENEILKNDSYALHEKVDDLMHLKSIDQLQTIFKLQHETQDLNLKVGSLIGKDQARGQDLLALYNKVMTLETNQKSMERFLRSNISLVQQNISSFSTELSAMQMNFTTSLEANEKAMVGMVKNSSSSIQQNITDILHVVQMKQYLALETLENQTNVELERAMTYNNASFANLEQRIGNGISKPVILTACHMREENIDPGIIRFSTIKTSVGVPDLSVIQSTGKFTCHEPGYYYVMTTIEAAENNAVLQIMVNSAEQHRQYVTGYTKDRGYWTPGTSALTIKLETNDQVWIAMVSRRHINRACLNIFKIS